MMATLAFNELICSNFHGTIAGVTIQVNATCTSGIFNQLQFLSHRISHISPIHKDITIPLAKMTVTSKIQPQRILEHIIEHG